MGIFDLGGTTVPEDGFFWSSSPSFLHALALTLISASLGLMPTAALALTLLVCLSWELAQSIMPHLGTFDLMDLTAVICGGSFGFMMVQSQDVSPKKQIIGRQILIAVFSFLTSVATSPRDSYIYRRKPGSHRNLVTPFYMSYEDLRSSYAVLNHREIQGIGKVARIGSLLFISERNNGVHVFNNSDPSNPVPLHFIVIPGNTDITAKGELLYADSFVDLLTIQTKGLEPPVLIDRLDNAFKWNPYQAIDDTTLEFESSELDSSRGVITGFLSTHQETSSGENR